VTTRLGRYEIVRPLARGGMAEVFLARTRAAEGFEKLVCVKRIRPELALDPQYVEMFLDEARLGAMLHHPNLVQVFDFGVDEDGPMYAMEWLHGEDLVAIQRAARAAGRPLSLAHAVGIVIGVCAGLHHAHELRDGDGRPLGIVHRDVSPHNVLVTYDGGVKVVDFGIAKARGARRAETQHGTLKGKVQYMSPEQCHGAGLDRRSDVFAIGILLWELTVGRGLYRGASDFAILKAITERDATRPSAIVPDYPAALEAIVMRALARDREARWATAEELQLALEEYAREARLAVSAVGLARTVRELFPDQVDAWAHARAAGGAALESAALSAIARRESTQIDDVADDEDFPTGEATRPDSAPSTTGRPPTRAVARRRGGRARLLVPAALLVAAGGATALVLATRTPTAAVATTAPRAPASAPAAAPAPVAAATPSPPPPVAPPTSQAETKGASTAPPQPKRPSTRAVASPSRAHHHTRSSAKPARRDADHAAAVDLDAPLPPR
jgi:serine/threonine protein kinase